MTAAVMSITSPAQAQLAWWGWPGLVAAGTGTGNPYASAYGYAPTYNYATGWSYLGYGYGYGTGYNYPAYAYGYGTGYDYPAYRYATSQYQPYSSYGGYGMWNNVVQCRLSPLYPTPYSPMGPRCWCPASLAVKSRPKYRRRCFDFRV
jgi:hypothetical protein